MMNWTVLRTSTVARLSMGLMALVVCLLMVTDLMLGVVPSPANAEQKVRQRLGESLAIQLAAVLESGDDRVLGRTLQQVVGRNADILSMAVRTADGNVVAQRGDHRNLWIAPETGRSSINHLRVPVNAERVHWGDVEITFAPSGPRTLREWLLQPLVLMFAIVTAGGFALFYLYLRRAMLYLDPSKAVPERVRKAFDVLADGVVVLDVQGRIVLANESFRKLCPDPDGGMNGRNLSELKWVQPAHAHRLEREQPWTRALRDAAAVSGEPLSIPRPDGTSTETIVGCAPITDGYGRLRGCIVTFDDVTEVHRTNERLRQTLSELEHSRAQIRTQNDELRQLAARDSLTGCYNRRAFFEMASAMFAEALRTNAEVSCIMADIDHFKQFNDLFGHAMGDQVIQVVARTLSVSMRGTDVLCRYGGEEFCMLLPGASLEQARAIAERMRVDIADKAHLAIRTTRVTKVTSSFGVASIVEGATRIEELIDQADNALYASKTGGRDQVSVWRRPEY